MSDRLAPILARRRQDAAHGRAIRPLAAVEAAIASLPTCRGFRRAVARRGLQVIAEIKRASPSAGSIRAGAEPAVIAARYADSGAACLSVLTEPHWFHGSDDDLRAARAAVSIPVLRKDFIVDPWQVAEARALGADCVLLIVAALGDETSAYYAQAKSYGLDVLVEVHDEAEMEVALRAGADLIGVNNRDLTSFTIDLAVSERLRPMVPAGTLFVAESGIESEADMRRMDSLGADAVLIGSALMKAPDPGAKLAALLAAVNPAAVI